MPEPLQSDRLPGDCLLVIFDGRCGLCIHAVRWLLAHDRLDKLRFVPSESPKVCKLLTLHGIDSPTLGPDTILVVRNLNDPAEKLLERSDAVVALLGALPRPWPAVGVALGWIPRPLRDWKYRLIARWRYRIWGRLESCPVPTPAERAKFL